MDHLVKARVKTEDLDWVWYVLFLHPYIMR